MSRKGARTPIDANRNLTSDRTLRNNSNRGPGWMQVVVRYAALVNENARASDLDNVMSNGHVSMNLSHIWQ